MLTKGEEKLNENEEKRKGTVDGRGKNGLGRWTVSEKKRLEAGRRNDDR